MQLDGPDALDAVFGFAAPQVDDPEQCFKVGAQAGWDLRLSTFCQGGLRRNGRLVKLPLIHQQKCHRRVKLEFHESAVGRWQRLSGGVS